jgi:hypothetical protein
MYRPVHQELEELRWKTSTGFDARVVGVLEGDRVMAWVAWLFLPEGHPLHGQDRLPVLGLRWVGVVSGYEVAGGVWALSFVASASEFTLDDICDDVEVMALQL